MALADKIHTGMKKHLEKTKASKKASQPETNKSGEVSHFEVHPIKGGHLLEKHFERRNSYDKPPKEPERSAHKSLGSAMKEMKGSCPCGICAGDEADTGVAVGGKGKSKSDDSDEQ